MVDQTTPETPVADESAPKITVTRRTRSTTPRRRTTPVESPAVEAPAVESPVVVAPTGDDVPAPQVDAPAPVVTTRTRRTTRATAGADAAAESDAPPTPAKKAASKKTAAKKTTAKKTATKKTAAVEETPTPSDDVPAESPAPRAARKTTTRKASTKKAAATAETPEAAVDETPTSAPEDADASEQRPVKKTTRTRKRAERPAPVETPEADEADDAADAAPDTESADTQTTDIDTDEADGAGGAGDENGEGEDTPARRRRRRGGRRRRRATGEGTGEGTGEDEASDAADEAEEPEAESVEAGGEEGQTRRRRRNRRREGQEADGSETPNTVTRVRTPRKAEDEITAVSGSTRLEAKKQRRREGREAGRRRAPIVSEAEFLARRESVERVMVIRQRRDLTQIAVLEDKVLVEHYVARESQTSLIGNVYLGRVQNVLPSMEAAFIDIGKGRNAVLYAGEVNWSALGHKEGAPRKIESVLSSGQTILVQVTKDPIGHKGARLTSQVSLAGRFLVYVPDGTTSGISRKLPDTERNRLKTLLKEIVPESAGVIVRTAAEGAAEDELTRDVERLKARWEDIEKQSRNGQAPKLLYGEPDLMLKVVRDLFTEDFTKLVVQGDDAWDTVHDYVTHVAPDLGERLEKYHSPTNTDIFAAYRVDEQIKKGLERKVWLPSGGSLIIDRTEAMTVVDVNTGKFTGQGGNLEETVTKNNLEAAEEIVRQLRLRDIGGIIVVDFIDMVLESNRDLVLRRLVECLGRDRTRHQVAEVTSLGLVQMTRKRIGTGLVEAFSHECEACKGRGLILEDAPVAESPADEAPRTRRNRGRKVPGDASGGDHNGTPPEPAKPAIPTPKDVAAAAAAHEAEAKTVAEADEVTESGDSEPAGAATDVGAPADGEVAPEVAVDAQPTAQPKTTRRRRTPRKVADPETAQAEISAVEHEAEPEDVTPQEVDAATIPDDGDEPASLDGEPTPVDGEAAHAFEIHVPVKKRGTRKR